MFSSKLLLVVLSALCTLSFAQDKPSLIDETLRNALEVEYDNDITPVAVTTRNVWQESIPEACLRQLGMPLPQNPSQPVCPVANIRVVQFGFADTTERTWVTCRCSTTQFTEAQMVDVIAKIPVGMRQFIRYFIAPGDYPGNNYGAHVRGQDMTFFHLGSAMAVHEIAHAIDPAVGGSSSSAYATAVSQDTCWVTPYALTHYKNNGGSLTESWADTFRYVRYHRHVGSLNDRIPGGIACMRKTFDVVMAQTNSIISAGYNAARSAPVAGTLILRVNAGTVPPYLTRRSIE